jgi:hypothetical protein
MSPFGTIPWVRGTFRLSGACIFLFMWGTIPSRSDASVAERTEAPPGSSAPTSLDQMKSLVREWLDKDPTLFNRPRFSQTTSELSYDFGGINRDALYGSGHALAPVEEVANMVARVEMIRRALAGKEALGYWEPVLSRADDLAAQALKAVEAGDVDQRALLAKVNSLNARAEGLLVEALEKATTARGHKAVPTPGPPRGVRYKTEYKTQTVPITITVVEQVPVTVNQTQYRTEYKTQTVPVTRSVTQNVRVTRFRIETRLVGNQYVSVTVPFEVIEPQTVQVTENVTQQYAVNVPYTVPVTTYQAQQKQVTQNVTQVYQVKVPVTEYKVKIVTNPPGGDVYYLAEFSYFVIEGMKFPDTYGTWKNNWHRFGATEEMFSPTTYYLRAWWDGRRIHRSNEVIAHDETITVNPND